MRHRWLLVILGGVYLAHQFFYRLYLGVSFETDFGRLWQLLDAVWLREHLWACLRDLHAQPPLHNLLLGAILHLPEGLHDAAFETVHQMLAVGGLAALYALAIALGLHRLVALALTLFFLWTPSFILYQNWIASSLLLMTLSTTALAGLGWYVRSGRTSYLHLAAAAGFLLTMTRPIYHSLWLLGMFILLATARRHSSRRICLHFAPYTLILVAWLAKNALLVGNFGMSTWFGMNLATGITTRLTTAEADELVATGVCTTIIRRAPWGSFDRYRDLDLVDADEVTRWAGRPWLHDATRPDGRPNFNFIGYPRIADAYRTDAVRAYRARPDLYRQRAFDHYFLGLCRPSHRYRNFLDDNQRKLSAYSDWFANYVEGDVLGQLVHIDFRKAYLDINVYTLGFPIALVAIPWFVLRWQRRHDDRWILLAAMGWTVGVQVAAIVLIDGGEGNRMRFEFEPLLLVVAALLATEGLSFVRRRE